MKHRTQNGFTAMQMKEVIKQEFKGISADGDSCKYRHEGRKCAVGCFIPDAVYGKDFENINADNLIREFPFLNQLMPLNKDGMQEFQKVHDRLSEGASDVKAKSALLMWIDENVVGE